MYRMLLLLLILIRITLNAQWFLQNPLPTTNSLFSLSVPNDSCFFAGGWGGLFIRSIDNGKTWSSDTIAKYPVWCVHFFDSLTGLVVTSDAGIFRTEDRGATWKKTSDRKIHNLYFINNKVGFAVGYGVVLKTTNSGNDWNAIYDLGNGTNYNITCIDFIDENYGWVAGRYGPPLKTTNGGNSWTEVYYNPGFSNEASDVDFIDKNNGWLLPYFDVLYRTSDGGLSWTKKYLNQKLNEIEVINLQVVYASGDSGIYKSSNGGIEWTKIYNGRIMSLSFKDEFTGYAINGYTIIKTTNGGVSWSNVSKNITSQHLNAIEFCDSTNGVIVGENGTILTTSDRGLNWQVNNIGTENLNDVEFQQNKTGWIAGNSSLLLSSNDSGKSWYPKIIDSKNSDLKSISFYDNNNGVIAGHNGILHYTYNGGQTWHGINIGTLYLMNSVFYLNENTVWAACDSGKILKISNGQIIKEYRLQAYPFPGFNLWIKPYSIHFYDEMNGIVAVGDYDDSNQARNGWIYKTTDGGNTWNLKKKKLSGTQLGWKLNITSLFVIDSLNTAAVSQSGEIFRSTDMGDSWGSQTSPTGENQYEYYAYNDIYFLNTDEAFLVGDNGINASTTNGGGEIRNVIIEVERINNNDILISEYNLSQNYPNPFNPVTTIDFSIPFSCFVSLKVFDLLGKEVSVLVNGDKSAGKHSIDFNASKLSSGIYLYRLQSGTFIESKKLILLR